MAVAVDVGSGHGLGVVPDSVALRCLKRAVTVREQDGDGWSRRVNTTQVTYEQIDLAIPVEVCRGYALRAITRRVPDRWLKRPIPVSQPY